VHPARQPRLRQKHRPELAGPYQANRDRAAGGLALEQHGMEIHGDPLPPSFPAPDIAIARTASSANKSDDIENDREP
jgi:hypothetical protein